MHFEIVGDISEYGLFRLYCPNRQAQSAAVKTLTRKQLESLKEKAARFVRDVLGDPGRADEIAETMPKDAKLRFSIIRD